MKSSSLRSECSACSMLPQELLLRLYLYLGAIFSVCHMYVHTLSNLCLTYCTCLFRLTLRSLSSCAAELQQSRQTRSWPGEINFCYQHCCNHTVICWHSCPRGERKPTARKHAQYNIGMFQSCHGEQSSVPSYFEVNPDLGSLRSMSIVACFGIWLCPLVFCYQRNETILLLIVQCSDIATNGSIYGRNYFVDFDRRNGGLSRLVYLTTDGLVRFMTFLFNVLLATVC